MLGVAQRQCPSVPERHGKDCCGAPTRHSVKRTRAEGSSLDELLTRDMHLETTATKRTSCFESSTVFRIVDGMRIAPANRHSKEREQMLPRTARSGHHLLIRLAAAVGVCLALLAAAWILRGLVQRVVP